MKPKNLDYTITTHDHKILEVLPDKDYIDILPSPHFKNMSQVPLSLDYC